MDDESTEQSSDSTSVLKVVRDETWYRNNLTRSGRFAVLLTTVLITLITFDVDTLSYEGCARLSREKPAVRYAFLGVRSSLVFISILTYYLLARTYEHSIGKAMIIMGFVITIIAFFVRPETTYIIYLRMLLDLPIRYFGLTYIQAFAGAIIHNWTFYGRELTRFHRLWIATIHFPGRIIKTFAAFFCEVSFAGGFPFQLLLHGSFLFGVGIFFVCAFDSVPSVNSLFTRKREKEVLEKDHMQNQYLSSSESSLFKPMAFLGEVLHDGRHIIAIAICRFGISLSSIGFYRLLVSKSKDYMTYSNRCLWTFVAYAFWLPVIEVIEVKLLKKSFVEQQVKLSLMYFLILIFSLCFNGGCVFVFSRLENESISPIIFTGIQFLNEWIYAFLALNGPSIRGAFVKPQNNHKCCTYYLIHVYAITLLWVLPMYGLWAVHGYEIPEPVKILSVLIGDILLVLGNAVYYIWEMIALKSPSIEKFKLN